MELYILRHGKAEERSPNITSDSKRRLTEIGKKELDCIGKAIKNLDAEFDYVVSSPLVRARQTADIILKNVKTKKKSLAIWDELKPEVDVEKTIKKLSSINPSFSILLVGHEPHLSSLVSKIISNSYDADISLKKGGFVHIKGIPEKSGFYGSLRSILTPKQLKKLCK